MGPDGSGLGTGPKVGGSNTQAKYVLGVLSGWGAIGARNESVARTLLDLLNCASSLNVLITNDFLEKE